jgi:hypothetical protein
MLRRIVFCAALPSLAVLACSSVIVDEGPEVEGRYVLRTVAGDPVPAVAAAHEGVTVTLIADTIILHRGGMGSETHLTTTDSPRSIANPSYDRTRPVVSSFLWQRRGDALVIEFHCPDMASCIAPPHRTGHFTATGLELDYAIQWRTPLVYERVE